MSRSDLFRSAASAALLVLGLLAAADAHAIEICGNGICNPNGFPSENYQTCPADCGGSTPNPCTTDSCTDCARPLIGANKDIDNVPDRLEHDLAHKFFPRVLLQHADVDRDESYLFEGFAIPYSVHSVLGSGPVCNEFFECLEIRYGIAFFEDHGDVGGAYSHLGDSEMYAAVVRRTTSWIEAQNNPSQWQMIRDFTSAHWGESWSESSKTGAYGFCPAECSTMYSDPTACNAALGCSFAGSCSGVHGGCLGQGYAQCQATGGCNWNGGCIKSSRWTCYDALPKTAHVNVFASESKHALYHTDSECDGGGFFGSDDCPKTPSTAFDMRLVKSNKLQNVGNFTNHGSFDVKIKHPDRCKLYDVWGGLAFGGGTAYKTHFNAPIDWLLD